MQNSDTNSKIVVKMVNETENKLKIGGRDLKEKRYIGEQIPNHELDSTSNENKTRPDKKQEDMGMGDLYRHAPLKRTEVCENNMSIKSTDEEIHLDTKHAPRKGTGRKFITIRCLPLGSKVREFRKILNENCNVVSTGIVTVNNIGWVLMYIQYNKENIEQIYRCFKACENPLS